MSILAEIAATFILYIKNKCKSNPDFMNVYNKLSLDEQISAMFTKLYEHERMLADKVRLDAYYDAIMKYVKEGDTVIDMGTGSGILAFFAALKAPKTIYAIDHANIIELAKLVYKNNNTGNIEFFKVKSKNFNISEKVDVIIQEQIGDYLFEENMIENIVDLRDKFLKVGGRIIPSKFELFVDPVKIKDEYHKPFIWEQNIRGIDYTFLRGALKEKAGRSHCYRGVAPYEVDYFLCNPEKVMSLDLEITNGSDTPKTVNRSGSACLNNFPRFISGIRAG